MEKGASGVEPLQHGLVGCFMLVLQKSVENRNVGPPNSHTDDPPLPPDSKPMFLTSLSRLVMFDFRPEHPMTPIYRVVKL